MTETNPIPGEIAARIRFESEDRLPDTPQMHDLFEALNAASQLGFDGKGVERVYPYVMVKGERYYLIKIEDL